MTVNKQIWGVGLLLVLVVPVVAGCAGAASPAAMESTASADESITNNQEAGVDEGGIVKAWGDYLVVLRRGRLFTVALANQGMDPVCVVDAFAPGEDPGSWYDELLVSDNTAVVVGYNYDAGATELGLFSLDEQGCIHHENTYYLQSNDYYSSRNYASRLVEGHLVFYMPHWLGDYDIEDGRIVADYDLPALGRASDGLFGGYDWDEIVDTDEVVVPSRKPSSPTLHTVVTCDLTGELTCHGRGIIGEFGRTFYVSRDAVYVWVSDTSYTTGLSTVYRLPLDGGASGELQAWGAPVDQFSFQERDGYLNVLVRNESNGDWMWGPEQSAGDVVLSRIPLSAFTATATALPIDAYTRLPGPPDASFYGFHNRFVGEFVLYNSDAAADYSYSGYSGYSTPAQESELSIYRVGGQGGPHLLKLPHLVERIEALGDNAVVIGSGPQGLYFTAIALGATPSVAGQYIQPSVSQGEQRSHGFFFRQDSPTAGVLGLPLQSGYTDYGYLTDASVAVLYLAVENLQFDSRGMLVAHPDTVDDRCVASCVDWYGNSRPIFYRDRVFALMGYELVEGVMGGRAIQEVGRIHLLDDQANPRLATWIP